MPDEIAWYAVMVLCLCAVIVKLIDSKSRNGTTYVLETIATCLEHIDSNLREIQKLLKPDPPAPK